MKNEEVNRIIAEYMGTKFNHICIDHADVDKYLCDLYTESLDALVPVWEKLEKGFEIKLSIFTHAKTAMIYDASLSDGYGDKVQQAAAHATAKAILELKK